MSDTELQSPRTAIRNWLQNTDSKSTTKPADALPEQKDIERGSRHPSRRQQTTRHPSKIRVQHDDRSGRKHQGHSKSGARQRHVADKADLVKTLQAQPQTHLKDTAVNSNSVGLAERLGLHAPFRTFKDHSDDDILDVQNRPRKRRRSRSSTSSYLEPAAANDLSDNDHDRPSHTKIRLTASAGPALGDRGRYSLPAASQASEMMLPSPGKLLKSYERKPRHKTRQDRYELKRNNRKSEKTNQNAREGQDWKRQKKRKRREKSGAALIHDFAAQNVAHDRLTLKPAKTLGLFGKGKASSPVKRRGLPDLAFSELAFLSSRREQPKDSFEDSSNKPSDKKKQRKSTKAADTEAEMSRYFLSAKPTTLDLKKTDCQRYQHDGRRSRDHKSSPPFVDLPDTAFLGFGSCGPNASISPAKISAETDSRSLRYGDARSSTRSTSYLTWSQSGGASRASPQLDKRHHIEPLTSSKLFNRKRTSPVLHKSQRSIPPESQTGVQTTASKIHAATASRPSSQHENANEAPGHSRKSRSAAGERLRSREKGQNHRDTAIVELGAAKIPQDIEASIPDSTHPAETATHGGPEPALTHEIQAPCQSSGNGPQSEPQAHDVRPLSAQMPIISPHQDPLNDILDSLLRDCNPETTGSAHAPHATSSRGNFLASEEARMPDRAQVHSRLPARAVINGIFAPEAPASASDSSRNPRSASLQQTSAHDTSRSTHTISRGRLNFSNRPSSGYPFNPTQSQVDSRNAWNGYDNLYEWQEEQRYLMPENSRERLPPHTVVRDDLLGSSRETGKAAAPDEHAHEVHFGEVGDEFGDERPSWYRTLQEGHEMGNYQGIRHGGWNDRSVHYGASYDSGATFFDESPEDWISGILSEDHVNDCQEREIIADDEPSFAQAADQHHTKHPLFTTNFSDSYLSWRPHQIFGRTSGLERCAANVRVQDVDAGLSGFWTPHKLY